MKTNFLILILFFFVSTLVFSQEYLKKEREGKLEAVGGGFFLKSIDFKYTNHQGLYWTTAVGEIVNKSGKDYEGVRLHLKFYNADEKLIEQVSLIFMNFQNESTKGFNEMINNLKKSQISFYKIQFDMAY